MSVLTRLHRLVYGEPLIPLEPERQFVRVLLIDHRGEFLPRSVWMRGEMYFACSLDDESGPEVRLLPHGKVKTSRADWIKGWEPVEPVEWQPDAAETAHEYIAALENEIATLTAELTAEKLRFSIVAAAVREAERTAK